MPRSSHLSRRSTASARVRCRASSSADLASVFLGAYMARSPVEVLACARGSQPRFLVVRSREQANLRSAEDFRDLAGGGVDGDLEVVVGAANAWGKARRERHY